MWAGQHIHKWGVRWSEAGWFQHLSLIITYHCKTDAYMFILLITELLNQSVTYCRLFGRGRFQWFGLLVLGLVLDWLIGVPSLLYVLVLEEV